MSSICILNPAQGPGVMSVLDDVVVFGTSGARCRIDVAKNYIKCPQLQLYLYCQAEEK